MKKLAISIAITSVLGLSACDDTSLKDVQQETEMSDQRVRVVFDPSNGKLSVPNDLLLSGTIDGTLEMPDETSAKDDGVAVDFSNPSAALGALDGWGTQNSFSIELAYINDELSIDASTVGSSDAVAIYQVEKFPSQTDADCSNSDYSGLICKGLAQLTYGVDYIATVSGGNIAVVLTKPLDAGASYAVALTSVIKDNNGNSLLPSTTYASVEQDISTTPIIASSLSDDELNASQASIRALQNLTNNFENVLESAFGLDSDTVVYTQVFSTQSAGVAGTDPLQVTKLLNAKVFAATADAYGEGAVATVITSEAYNVAQAFAAAGQTLTATATSLYSSSNVYSAEIEVPYYLETPETGDPLSGRWEAACDSGAILASLTDDVLATGTAGDNNTTCAALGLADLGFDTQRHLTKYNPLPDTKSTETIDVQVTLPDIPSANAFRSAVSSGTWDDIAKPTDGWPIVIIQHGITSKKEDMLATTGWLSAMGYATVAIDHPLHGERGFEVIDGDTTTVINTSTSKGGVATTYFNLSSLLTSRDNLRQSTADILKLRLALNGFTDGVTLNLLDASNVYFMGHSLGAISGVNAVAIANTPVTADTVADSTIEDETVRDATAEATATALNNLYKIKAAVFANPGASIANFLVESGSFSPLVKASVVYGLDNELTEALQANIADIANVLGANLAGDNPSEYCQELAIGSTEESDVLICAFDEFMNNASAAEQTAVATAVTQFAFAAQATLDAGDPSNYTQLLKALQTPVLVYEIAGDGTDDNLPDQTIPNSVSSDPFKGIAGTTGLANQLGLAQIVGAIDATTATSGIVRFTSGSHSTFPNPSDEADTDGTATVHTEMQTLMYQFFNSDGKTYSPTAGKCVIKDVLDDSCTD